MVSTKELLAKKLQQNTQKHQLAQKEQIKDLKELRRNVNISDIAKSPNQPRKIFEEEDIRTLAESINEVGLLQPISVRKIDNSHYELIAGERRLRAHQFLNKATIDVIIIDADDQEVALLTLAENLKREDLTDYEIYNGLVNLDESLKKNKQKLAKSLGLNREDMYKYLSYEKLPEIVLNDLNDQPALLGRTAATAMKKFLSDHKEIENQAQDALIKAWKKVKAKELEQTKAVIYAEKLLIAPTAKPQTASIRKIEFNGKVAGNIKSTANQLKIDLKVSPLSDAQIDQLETLLKDFIQQQHQV